MGTHAFMSPSNFSKCQACPAAALREFQVKQLQDLMYKAGPVFYGLEAEDLDRWELINNNPSERKYHEDGTKLHAVLEDCLNDGINAPEDIIALVEAQDTAQRLHTDDYIMMRFVSVINEQLEQLETAERVGVERKIVVSGLPQGGTIDLSWGYERVLYLRDLKAGRVEVSSEENHQLMNYAVGILDEEGWDAYDSVDFKILGLHFESESWTCSVDKLRAYKHDVMLPAFLKAYQLNPEAIPGDQCLYCAGKIACPEWQAKFNDGMEKAESSGITSLSSDEKVELFRLCKQAYYLQKDLQKELLSAFEGFDEPQGITRVDGRKTVKWADEDEAMKLMKKKHGASVIKQELKSPKVLKQLLGDDSIPEDLTHTVIGSPYLKL
jgi:hypothetical protein